MGLRILFSATAYRRRGAMATRLTLDRLDLVRIQVRQLSKSPLWRGFSSCPLRLTPINSRLPPLRYGKHYGSGCARPAGIRDLLIRSLNCYVPISPIGFENTAEIGG